MTTIIELKPALKEVVDAKSLDDTEAKTWSVDRAGPTADGVNGYIENG